MGKNFTLNLLPTLRRFTFLNGCRLSNNGQSCPENDQTHDPQEKCLYIRQALIKLFQTLPPVLSSWYTERHSPSWTTVLLFVTT